MTQLFTTKTLLRQNYVRVLQLLQFDYELIQVDKLIQIYQTHVSTEWVVKHQGLNYEWKKRLK